jgi:DNA-binding NarL/FixJ family response regulator
MNDAIRVFLADGHIAVRDALCALIATAPDMEVVGGMADGDEVLETAQRLQPDVIVLDPVMFGDDHRAPTISLLRGLTQAQLLILTD